MPNQMAHLPRHIYKTILALLVLSCAVFVMIAVRVFYKDTIRYAFLLWNLFLAWIPLVLALIISLMLTPRKSARSISVIILTALWLLFYPNTLYLITDMIHVDTEKFVSLAQYTYRFNNDFGLWYDFTLLTLASITGVFLGFVSLCILHARIKERHGSLCGWIFVLFATGLSSFGVYLGRFIRLNSWDIVSNPLWLIRSVLASVNLHTLKLCSLFFLLFFLLYIVLYSIMAMGRTNQ